MEFLWQQKQLGYVLVRHWFFLLCQPHLKTQIDFFCCFHLRLFGFCVGLISKRLKMSEIETGLYLGGIEDALNAQWVSSMGVTHILTVDSVDLKRKYRDVQHKWLQADDNETADILSHLETCCRFISGAIEGSVGRVLVHCQWGVSRSASVVCAYIMKKYLIALDDAITKVRAKRPQI